MVKMMVLLARRPELSAEEFRSHWLEVHAPLVQALPGLRRYAQDHVIGKLDIPDVVATGAEIDGIAELWFDDRGSMERAFASEAGKTLAADGAQFVGRATFLVVDEKTIAAD